VEIGTSNIIPTTTFVVQHVIKPFSRLRGGTSLEIIPLVVQTSTIHVLLTTIITQLVEGNEKSNKEHVELVNPSFAILDSRLEFLEFISINVPLTKHQISIGHEVILISSTMHVLEVFTTPVMTFEDTPDHQKSTSPINLQILNQMELVEITGVEPVEEVISKPIVEGQCNLGL
jgi:hypothetical protein